MSSTNVVILLNMATDLPEENKSINNIRRMDGLRFILPSGGHSSQVFIKVHLNELESYMPKWERMEMSHPSLHPEKGVLYLQYLVLHVSRYWYDQSTSLIPVVFPYPKELFVGV